MGASTEEYIIRLYRSGDEDQIVKLLAEVFEQWPRFDINCSPVDHWRWKFLDNPANKEGQANVVIDYNGEIVGVYHSMFFYTKIGKTRYLTNKGSDVAIQAKHQGKGLYTKLSKLKRETEREIFGSNYYFTYSLTANPILINRKSKDPEYPFPHPLKYLVKIDDVETYFEKVVKEKNPLKKTYLKLAVYGSKTLNKLANLFAQPPQPRGVTFREIAKFDEGIDVFYEKVKPHYNFIVEKTMTYMNWRYCDKRGGDFKVWLAEESGEVVGFLVLRINSLDPGYPVGFVIDLLALTGRDDVAECLLKLAVDYFSGRGVGVVHAQLIGGHPYERLFGRYGFLDSRMVPHLAYRASNLGEDLEMFTGSPASMLHYPYGEGDAI